MSKTSIIIATVTNKEEMGDGELKYVRIALQHDSIFQKEFVNCCPLKADKINVEDYVEVSCDCIWKEYRGFDYSTMQVTSIKKIELPK